MIKLSNVNKLYLGEDLLKDVSWHMKPGEKIGLIGANGTGKTTQLRIICGLEELDNGEVYVAPNTTIGYLTQEPIVNSDFTLDEELLSVFKDVLNAEKQIQLLQKEISALEPGDILDDSLKTIATLQEVFDLNEGYTIHAKIGQVISGLGFSEEDRSKLIKTFSGGWQMRVSIAKLLLEAPDLLLLDEPTNHLDIKAIEWLESYLSSYKGGYIIVSHDRQFLDRTVEKILEMDGAYVRQYSGNYTKYLQEKELRYQVQLSAYKTQQEKITRDKAFIEKFRANANRSSQAKSREKQLEKLELIAAPSKEKKFKFNFPVSLKSGDDVYKLTHLTKAFDEKVLFEDLNLEIRRKDKIALIGDNGSGKTTLMRIILELDKDYKGKVKPGHLVKPIYFSQHEARGLSGSKTAYDELHDSAPAYTNEQVRSILGRLGITGDNVFKSLDDLSGGEKARLALAKMLMAGANFLLFDEPTNHLDIPAKEALEEAITSFEGTVMVISHDRKFIDNFANKIFIIENKNISVYPGNYSDYKYKKDRESHTIQAVEVKQKHQKISAKPDLHSLKTQELPKKLSPKAVEKQTAKIENEIIALEEKIELLETKLADPDLYRQNADEFMSCSQELDEARSKLEQLNNNWLELLEMQESF